MLVDIVSRNGNLMLNFPLPNSGALDDAELKILDEITRWMAVNGEAIYAHPPVEDLRRRPGGHRAAIRRAAPGSTRPAARISRPKKCASRPRATRSTRS